MTATQRPRQVSGLSTMDRLLLFWHTLRHLRWGQFYWRLYLLFARVSRRERPAPLGLCLVRAPISTPIERVPSWLGDGFRFLNREVRGGSIPWNSPGLPKLWLYNLHYFDCLQQPDLGGEVALSLMQAWMQENPPFAGNGWEPYPISLRIVNWLKFEAREELDAVSEQMMTRSLYQQARYLRRSLEYHLRANHVFKNGVALVFAGARLRGASECNEWLLKGMEILRSELAEQILPDGGHFERSPMYHAIIAEDVLDCLNVLRAFLDSQMLSDASFETSALEAVADLVGRLRESANRMLDFLVDIVHPDGELPRFNDTAEGVAPTLDQLRRYAARLAAGEQPSSEERLTSLPARPGAAKAQALKGPQALSVAIERESPQAVPQSGHRVVEKPDFGLCILSRGPWRCILDSGPVGPDYQPGHAHCDTLSYELTLDGVLVAVNAGTFEYAGALRNLYRSTRSHNTLEIDDEEQHEIWSTFRVARRGYPQRIQLSDEGERALFSGEHTGYQRLPGRPIHRRSLALSAASLEVTDEVLSQVQHRMRSRVHLHPGVAVTASCEGSAQLIVAERVLALTVERGRLMIEDYAFSREFGVRQPAKVLVIDNALGLEPRLAYRLELG